MKKRGYRISVDDNIRFLQNIASHPEYTSLFDDPYLRMYRDIHGKYGTKVHFNLFYQSEDGTFNLSMMPDRFQDEWAANSDWLKLNFHAKADKPDMPYKNTDYDTIYRDCKQVMDEIVRFAGKDTLSDETTIHWGECTYEGVKAVRDLGIKNLAGYFMLTPDEPTVSYFYPKYLVDRICKRDFWYDTELDVFCCKIDKVLNLYTVKENLDMLSVLCTDRAVSGFIEIMIHEEYFYPDYAGYKPDFEALVLEPCRLISEKGYKGTFISEVR